MSDDGDERGRIVYLDRSLDVRAALIAAGRAEERLRLARPVGWLIGSVIGLVVSIVASALGFNGFWE